MVGKNVFRCVTAAFALAVLVNVQEAQAQRRGGGMRMGPQGVSPLTVVTNAAVQKDLNVKTEQADKLKDLGRDVQEERRDQLNGSGLSLRGLQDLSREEREKRMAEFQAKSAEINKAVNDKFMPILAKILDKDQMTRLKEIAIQAAGSEALHDADVVKELGLSKEQQDKIKKVADDFRAKSRELFTGGGGGGEEARAKITELREEQTAKTLEVLSKDQQAQFTKLKGKPFDVKQLRQGGGGRNRRRDSN